MRIVLLGAPGSGKETQAARLSARYCIASIFVPELLRQAAREKSDLAVRVAAFLDLGQHVPDEITLLVLKERLCRQDDNKGFLLVDFPRTAHQAQALDQLLQELGFPLDLILRLEGDPDHFMERLEGRETCSACGAIYNLFVNPPRVEAVCDRCGARVRHYVEYNREAIFNLMRVYDNQSVSLVQYYSLAGELRRIQGDTDIAAVFQRLCLAIEQKLPVSPGSPAVASKTTGKKRVSRKKSMAAKKGVSGHAEGARKSVPSKKGVSADMPVAGKKNTTAKKSLKKRVSRKKAPVRKEAAEKVREADRKTVKKKSVRKKVVAGGKVGARKKRV